jgi:hypothetical protein
VHLFSKCHPDQWRPAPHSAGCLLTRTARGVVLTGVILTHTAQGVILTHTTRGVVLTHTARVVILTRTTRGVILSEAKDPCPAPSCQFGLKLLNQRSILPTYPPLFPQRTMILFDFKKNRFYSYLHTRKENFA